MNYTVQEGTSEAITTHERKVEMSNKKLDFYLNAPIKEIAQHALDTREEGEAVATMSCINVRAYIASQRLTWITIVISAASFLLSSAAFYIAIRK